MALTRAAAATALARVAGDPDARERFLRAYTADEDALAALQEAADPALPSPSSLARTERIAQLGRAAYGRTSTPEEDVAASRASDEIAWEDGRRAAVAAALETAVAAIDPHVAAPGAAARADPATKRR